MTVRPSDLAAALALALAVLALAVALFAPPGAVVARRPRRRRQKGTEDTGWGSRGGCRPCHAVLSHF